MKKIFNWFKNLWQKEVDKIDVGLVHGKLKKKAKDQVIKKFREGTIQLLVCIYIYIIQLES